MDINKLATMCHEYKIEVERKLKPGVKVIYIGPVDNLPGGAKKHGLIPGVLCVKIEFESKKFREYLKVCLGIGTADGRKMDPAQAAAILNGMVDQAEKQRAMGPEGDVITP